MSVSEINAMMNQAVGRVFPGAQLLVFLSHRVLYEGCWGRQGRAANMPRITPDTAFDLASLTKPMATAALAMILVDQGVWGLEQTLGDIMPETRQSPVGEARIRALLNHSSGLPAWRPWGQELLGRHSVDIAGTGYARSYIIKRLYSQTLDTPPVYSDLGYMLLGLAIERVTNTSLDRAFYREIAVPLHADLSFVRVTAGQPDKPLPMPVAAARETSLRGMIHGVVDDDNAFVLGGVAGHAGLFGSARQVHRLLAAWLDAFLRDTKPFPGRTVREFWSGAHRAGTFVLGFDTPTPGGSSAGRNYPSGLVGHLGFTGTSFWLHPQSGLGVILLTNRVNQDPKDNTGIRSFRPLLHDLVWQTFGGDL